MIIDFATLFLFRVRRSWKIDGQLIALGTTTTRTTVTISKMLRRLPDGSPIDRDQVVFDAGSLLSRSHLSLAGSLERA